MLLGPFATVEPQDHGPGTPDHGPRASDHGPLVLGWWTQLGGDFVWGVNAISIQAPISSQNVPFFTLSGVNY